MHKKFLVLLQSMRRHANAVRYDRALLAVGTRLALRKSFARFVSVIRDEHKRARRLKLFRRRGPFLLADDSESCRLLLRAKIDRWRLRGLLDRCVRRLRWRAVNTRRTMRPLIRCACEHFASRSKRDVFQRLRGLCRRRRLGDRVVGIGRRNALCAILRWAWMRLSLLAAQKWAKRQTARILDIRSSQLRKRHAIHVFEKPLHTRALEEFKNASSSSSSSSSSASNTAYNFKSNFFSVSNTNTSFMQ